MNEENIIQWLRRLEDDNGKARGTLCQEFPIVYQLMNINEFEAAETKLLSHSLLLKTLKEAGRLKWIARLQYEYKHHGNDSSYTKAPLSALQDEVPENFPDSSYEEGEETYQLTWLQYCNIVKVNETHCLLGVGRLKSNDGTRSFEMPFEEWSLWYDYFGKDNIFADVPVEFQEN